MLVVRCMPKTEESQKNESKEAAGLELQALILMHEKHFNAKAALNDNSYVHVIQLCSLDYSNECMSISTTAYQDVQQLSTSSHSTALQLPPSCNGDIIWSQILFSVDLWGQHPDHTPI